MHFLHLWSRDSAWLSSMGWGQGVHVFIHTHQVVLQEVWASHLKERCQTWSTLIKYQTKNRRQEKKWGPLVTWNYCHSLFTQQLFLHHGQTLCYSPRIWQRRRRKFLPSWQDNHHSIPWCIQEGQCQGSLQTWHGHITQTGVGVEMDREILIIGRFNSKT